MVTTKERSVVLASAAELHRPSYYLRLWLAARNTRLSRRRWLDAIADCFRDFEGDVYEPSGSVYALPEVDDIFPDSEMRWMSYYLEANPSVDEPRRRSTHLERLQLIDLYFRIQHPDIARRFGQ